MWLRWLTWLDPAIRTIRRHIPKEATVLLVDDETLETEVFGSRRIRPFLEHQGMYWGSPTDDAHALQELQRMRREGVEYLVFAWPAFWWLEHYDAFRREVEARFPMLANTTRFKIFDVRTDRLGSP